MTSACCDSPSFQDLSLTWNWGSLGSDKIASYSDTVNGTIAISTSDSKLTVTIFLLQVGLKNYDPQVSVLRHGTCIMISEQFRSEARIQRC